MVAAVAVAAAAVAAAQRAVHAVLIAGIQFTADDAVAQRTQHAARTVSLRLTTTNPGVAQRTQHAIRTADT